MGSLFLHCFLLCLELGFVLYEVGAKELSSKRAQFEIRNYPGHVLKVERVDVLVLGIHRGGVLEHLEDCLLVDLWLKVMHQFAELIQLHHSILVVIKVLNQLYDLLVLVTSEAVSLHQNHIDETLLTDLILV